MAVVRGLLYPEIMHINWRSLSICIVSITLLVVSSPGVSSAASWIQYQSSPVDTYNRPDLPAAYDITQVDFGVSSADESRYMFFLDFAQPVTALSLIHI